ncbi:hypothetical protein VN97_g114 [Penicillium thymicola]|uniref:Uncharacterized protein n=1 Tax=Penicillium thymicola TaxID=293382 RepID=A0AAI9TVX8_PENTH|nr:hypothetical protein VN97_g114 [Penicillium thymicola]
MHMQDQVRVMQMVLTPGGPASVQMHDYDPTHVLDNISDVSQDMITTTSAFFQDTANLQSYIEKAFPTT